MKRNLRVFFVGDELIAGLGDKRALGWSGRVVARTPLDPPLLAINLAFPGESSATLTNRWEGEVLPRRSKNADNRLVIGLGSHDLDAGLSSARSRLYLANLLDNAERHQLASFVVGPPPRPDVEPARLAELSRAFSEVCSRRDIPYVDTYEPLSKHAQWATDMAISGGYTPRQAGYGLIAWLVLHHGWHQWLGIKSADLFSE